MDLIRKKIYVITGMKMLIALMFVGFGMTAGILTGAIQNFGGYIKGYNSEYITSLKDFENITMYNTKIIEVENITPTNIKYYDGFTKKRAFNKKQKTPQGEYYLAEFQGIVIFLMGNKEDFVLKKNGKYEVKGKLEILTKWFLENRYTEVAYSMNNPQTLRPFAVNAVSPWKREGSCYYMLFLCLGLPSLILFIKYAMNIIFIEKHSSYRKLKHYGDWKVLKYEVENEIKSGEYEECESQILTKNFLILKSYYSVKIIPRSMIIHTFVEYGLEINRMTMGRMIFILLNGEEEILFIKEKKIKKIVKWLEYAAPAVNIDEEHTLSDIKLEELLKIREFWSDYLKKDNMPLVTLKSKGNNELYEKKNEYIEMIREGLKKNI